MWEGILIALDICKFHIVTFRLTAFLVFDKIRLTFFPFFLSLIDIDLRIDRDPS